MERLSVFRVPEAQTLLQTGKRDTRLNGRIAAQFINRSNSELTRKNYISNLQQFILFSGRKDALDVQVDDVLALAGFDEATKSFASHNFY